MRKRKEYLSTEAFMQAWKENNNHTSFVTFAEAMIKAHKDANAKIPNHRQINMRCFRINKQIKEAGYDFQYHKPKWVKRENMTIAELLATNPNLIPKGKSK